MTGEEVLGAKEIKLSFKQAGMFLFFIFSDCNTDSVLSPSLPGKYTEANINICLNFNGYQKDGIRYAYVIELLPNQVFKNSSFINA